MRPALVLYHFPLNCHGTLHIANFRLYSRVFFLNAWNWLVTYDLLIFSFHYASAALTAAVLIGLKFPMLWKCSSCCHLARSRLRFNGPQLFVRPTFDLHMESGRREIHLASEGKVSAAGTSQPGSSLLKWLPINFIRFSRLFCLPNCRLSIRENISLPNFECIWEFDSQIP